MGIANSKAGLQRRGVRDHEWTKTKRAIFLDVLGATCNVRAAARAAGMSSTNAYGLRQRDGEFARLWRDAFVAGRERLHEELIAHALGQVPTGDNPGADEINGAHDGPAIAFDPDRAIAVLKLQGGFGGAGRAVKAASAAEIDAALMARLEKLARHRKPS